MSNDYNRGWGDGVANHKMVEAIVDHFNPGVDWEGEAYKQRNRARSAESQLEALITYTREREAEIDALRAQIEEMTRDRKEMERLRAETNEAHGNLRANATKLVDMLDAAAAEQESYLTANKEAEAVARHNAEVAKHWEEAAKSYEKDFFTAMEIARANGAMAAGFEAIYKTLVLEILQKHDINSFQSLDPSKRMSVMDEAWADFIQTVQYEYSPDLSFSYAVVPVDGQDEDDANLSAEDAREIDKKPEGQ